MARHLNAVQENQAFTFSHHPALVSLCGHRIVAVRAASRAELQAIDWPLEEEALVLFLASGRALVVRAREEDLALTTWGRGEPYTLEGFPRFPDDRA